MGHPIETEIEVFGVGFQPGFRSASITQLVNLSAAKGGYRIIIHDRERITRIIELLNVRKLVLVPGVGRAFRNRVSAVMRIHTAVLEIIPTRVSVCPSTAFH